MLPDPVLQPSTGRGTSTGSRVSYACSGEGPGGGQGGRQGWPVMGPSSVGPGSPCAEIVHPAHDVLKSSVRKATPSYITLPPADGVSCEPWKGAPGVRG